MSSSYKPLETEETEKAEKGMVDVPISPPVVAVVAAADPAQSRCFFSRCCGCFTLSTGVAIMAYLDLFTGLSHMLMAGGLLLARTHEHAIDGAVASAMANATQLAVDYRVAQMNVGIDSAFALSPLLALFAALSLVAGCWGLRAAKHACALSARRYYVWKLAQAFWLVTGALLGERTGGLQCMLAVYFALVTRSYWLKVASEDAVLILPTTSAPPAARAPAPPAPPAAHEPAVTSNPIVFVGNPVN